MENINKYFSLLSCVIDNEINNAIPTGYKFLQKSFHECKTEIEKYCIDNTKDKTFLTNKIKPFLTLIQKYEDWYNVQNKEKEEYIKKTTKYLQNNGVSDENIKEFFNHANKLPDCCIVTTLTNGSYNLLTEHGILNTATNETKQMINEYFPDIRTLQETGEQPQPNTRKFTNEQKEVLREYFISTFKGIGNDINYFETALLPDLQKTNRNGKKYAEIALCIYNSKYFKKTQGRKITSFFKWYRIYCNILEIKQMTYRPARLNPEDVANEFYYL